MAIDLKAANLRLNNSKRNAGNTEREVDPALEGAWLNIGVTLEDGTFIRLPLGVPVANLQTKPVYANSDPEYAQTLKAQNQLVTQLQAASAKLGDGDSLPIDAFTVQLYKSSKPVVESDNDELLIDLGLSI